MSESPAGHGPIAEEASRLFQAVQAWARTLGPVPHGDPGDPGDPGESGESGERAHSGGPEPGRAATCRVCPVCQLIALVREARPEAVDHLGDAVESLALAMHELLDGYLGGSRADRRDRFEHVDIG